MDIDHLPYKSSVFFLDICGYFFWVAFQPSLTTTSPGARRALEQARSAGSDVLNWDPVLHGVHLI